MARVLVSLACTLLTSLTSSAVSIAATPAEAELSAYEQQTLDDALERLDGRLELHPEGKRLEAIDIEVLDIIEERDPAPNFLNWFHTNTLREVVARELLVQVGESYQQSLVAESERNLRGLRHHSLVLCRPIEGSRPDTVRLLVVVKDVWSLRLNTSYRFKGGALEYLFLQPSEENLAGTQRRVAAQLVYKPDTLAIGGRFVEPRLADSRYTAVLDANVIVNHSSGATEGSYGTVQYGLPLYSTQQQWGWGALFEWRKEISRSFTGLDLRTYDAAATAGDDAIPYVYRTSTRHGRVSVTRSFGGGTKQELQVGIEAETSSYAAVDAPGVLPIAMAEFESEELPRSDARFGPYVQYHLYQNTFTSLLDLETMGLQEDWLIGPELYLRLYPMPRWLGSTRNVVGAHAEAAYTAPLGTGLARAYVASTVEVNTDAGVMSDSAIHGGVRLATPRLGFGRLVLDSTVLTRPQNYLNVRSSLGGGDRLRGYASDQFLGKDLVVSNVELRTVPLQLWTVQLGGVLFYDIGHAFDGFDSFVPHQGAGFGLRLVFPQLERAVTRIDWGFPLTAHGSAGTVFDGLVVTFRQAFGMPDLTGRSVRLAEGS